MNPDNIIRTDDHDEEELPVEPEEEQQPEVRLVTRTYEGNEYEMPEHLARVWDERNAAYVRKLSEQAERIRREALQTREAPQPRPPQPEVDPDTEWYASPSQKEARLRAELRQEFQADLDRREAQREFWNDFWLENPDLRGKNLVVRAAFQELLPGGAHMTPEEFRENMAATVRSQLGIGPAPKRTQTTSDRPVTSAPARGPAPAPRRSPAQEEPPSSLQSTIRAMQEAKRKAFLNPPDDTDAPQPRRGRGR